MRTWRAHLQSVRVNRLLLLGFFLTCASPAGRATDLLDLSGLWRLRLDATDEGIAAGWSAAPIPGEECIHLPNTTDLAGFGSPLDTNTMLHAAPFPVTTRFPGVKEPIHADERGYLVRRHLFVGAAWYEREVEIPATWDGRPLALCLERALWQTQVWVDGRPIGVCDSLVAEHRHELGTLAPGRHRLTIRVDNRMIHNLSTITHAYGPETQSRWNGLIGRLRLEASPRLSIRSLAVYPAPDRRSARVLVSLLNAGGETVGGTLKVRLCAATGENPLAEPGAGFSAQIGASVHEVVVALAQPAQAWDEFHPERYRVEVAAVTTGEVPDTATAWFGFRHVERVGKEIRLNGRAMFLRGTLDCAVYPRTGHPPMTAPEWERILGVVREYGFNHVRFHTWCPPEAAFEAADRLGVYLQPEAPAWVDDWGVETVTKPLGIGRDPEVEAYLRTELRRMSETYGNHPSFLLCSIGNEFGMKSTDWDRVNAMVEEIKAFDPRRLYTACGARKHLAADDFWYTHHTGASTRGVGPAHTDWDFASALEASPVPVIAHETGQRPVFPDYDKLLPKFTGPLLPLNLDRYRRSLIASGLAGQLPDFVRASARFQLVQYKAEHEAMLRTRGYSGYQLLMLNDFTGQSEALVGILDPFWESKSEVSAREVRAWNAPTVVLARFPKYVWTANETLQARIEVAHFGGDDLPAGPARWSIETPAAGAPGTKRLDGRRVAQGEIGSGPIRAGGVTELGPITLPLRDMPTPAALTLTVEVGGARNEWKLWVFPASVAEAEPSGVLVTRTFDDAARRTLQEGGKVLLLAHDVQNPHAARTGFESVYWSAGWWGNKFSSLGVRCDPTHPALAAFPNEGWSDWQWRELCAGATTFELTGAPPELQPIVQPVPDFHFNTRLGQVFEARVGTGSLLVCGYDVTSDLEHRAAARQFRQSLYRYVASEAFRPAVGVPLAWLAEVCAAAQP